MRSANDYLADLQALMTPGIAWTREPTANLTMLLLALADGFSVADARVDDFLNEADPSTTVEMLSDWEADYGLPDNCVSGFQTIQQRRNALIGRIAYIGDQSRAGIIAQAAAIGFDITITEFKVFTCNSTCIDPVYDEPWRFAWEVNAPAETVIDFTCESACDEPLAVWGNTLLECTMRRISQAHTTVIFSYGD